MVVALFISPGWRRRDSIVVNEPRLRSLTPICNVLGWNVARVRDEAITHLGQRVTRRPWPG